MEGEDSREIDAMHRAADDYDLLAANFSRQPATDRQEDLCRWRAHELRRLGAWTAADERITAARHTPWLGVVTVLVVQPLRWLWFIVVHVVARWLIQRTCVGYLLQLHRIAVSAGFVLGVCWAIYAVFASDATIVRNLEDPSAVPPWEGGVWARVLFGLYFSLTTFVTLGYGDFAPQSWFKLVTGLEGLLGVTLLALFTVAWGRKLVR